jgi:hypothetical protein
MWLPSFGEGNLKNDFSHPCNSPIVTIPISIICGKTGVHANSLIIALETPIDNKPALEETVYLHYQGPENKMKIKGQKWF